MHLGHEAHMERLLGEVSSRDAACTVPVLEGVYQMGSGVFRRIYLQSLLVTYCTNRFWEEALDEP